MACDCHTIPLVASGVHSQLVVVHPIRSSPEVQARFLASQIWQFYLEGQQRLVMELLEEVRMDVNQVKDSVVGELQCAL